MSLILQNQVLIWPQLLYGSSASFDSKSPSRQPLRWPSRLSTSASAIKMPERSFSPWHCKSDCDVSVTLQKSDYDKFCKLLYATVNDSTSCNCDGNNAMGLQKAATMNLLRIAKCNFNGYSRSQTATTIISMNNKKQSQWIPAICACNCHDLLQFSLAIMMHFRKSPQQLQWLCKVQQRCFSFKKLQNEISMNHPWIHNHLWTRKAIMTIHELKKSDCKAPFCIASAIAMQVMNLWKQVQGILQTHESKCNEACRPAKSNQDEMPACECDRK